MKKTIIIIGAIVILTLIVGVWAYLFTYGTPKSANEVFTQFGLGGNDTATIVTSDDTRIDVGEGLPATTGSALQQLTTRPVAGATFTSDSEILYVEQGTGHIYSINLIDGKETLKSGTTIAQTREALFAKGGTHVAITAYTNFGNETLVYEIGGVSSSTNGFGLPVGATNIAFGKATGTLMYTEKGLTGSVGYSYNMQKGITTEVFRIPLRDVRVLWGEPIYVYTSPTATQSGHLYTLTNSTLSYTTAGGNGLVGFRYNDGVVVTRMIDGVRSIVAHTTKGNEGAQILPFIPEKCTTIADSLHTVYCAIPTDMQTSVFPDDWYKGVTAYTDILWRMDIQNGEATGLSDLLVESGREIDIAQIGTTGTGSKIWFVNKNDNALWTFTPTSE